MKTSLNSPKRTTIALLTNTLRRLPSYVFSELDRLAEMEANRAVPACRATIITALKK